GIRDFHVTGVQTCALPISDIIILGWVRTIRISKNVAFVELNDGSCMKNIQGVVDHPENFPVLEQIATGAAVRLQGTLVPSQGQEIGRASCRESVESSGVDV